MTPEEARLTQEAHQFLYYVLARPVWSDREYDTFCRQHGLEPGGGSDCADHYSPEAQAKARALLGVSTKA